METSIFEHVLDLNDVNTWKDIWGNPIKRGAPVVVIKTDKGVPCHAARVVGKDPWKQLQRTGSADLKLRTPDSFAKSVLQHALTKKEKYEHSRSLLHDYYRHVIKKGCDNPNCQYHRNGELVFKNHPEFMNLSEDERYEIASRQFEWNHLDRDDKYMEVAKLRNNVKCSWTEDKQKFWLKQMYKEILKCELLCCNCHRIKTNIEGHYSNQKIFASNYEDYCKENDIPQDYYYHQWTKLWS